MKKLLLILLCLLTLCACGKEDGGTMVIEEGDEPEWLAGGWYVNPELPAINDAYFDNAVNKETEVYTPLLLLASQVVAGRNNLYLAYNGQVGYDANSAYKLVKVYVDLQDNASLLETKDFVVEDYLDNNASAPETLVGGFTVNEELPNLLDEETNIIFTKAIDGIVGVEYEPICVLSSQVVAGTNYAFLAKGTTITQEAQTNLYILKVYEATDGSVELNNICALDFE